MQRFPERVRPDPGRCLPSDDSVSTVGSALTTLTGTAAIGSALLGGLYLAFSVAILPALNRRPAGEATAFMQEANRVIQNPVFLLVFVGTAIACALVAGSAIVEPDGARGLRAAGGLVGLVGFVSTAAVNIPLNNGLDREGVSAWETFAQDWVPANHLRAATSVLAAVLLLLALRAER